MAEYRAVNGRCALDFSSLSLPISKEEAQTLLLKNGFSILDVDIIDIARECIKTSTYKRGARPSEAPAVVDCSSLIKYLYGQKGIWLPRRTIQQCQLGEKIDPKDIRKGDVIFKSGRINYTNPLVPKGVGHVGIATGEGTVIHAMNKQNNVVETSLEKFIAREKLRDIRRYISLSNDCVTLQTPKNREIETSDDIYWVLFQLNELRSQS